MSDNEHPVIRGEDLTDDPKGERMAEAVHYLIALVTDAVKEHHPDGIEGVTLAAMFRNPNTGERSAFNVTIERVRPEHHDDLLLALEMSDD